MNMHDRKTRLLNAKADVLHRLDVLHNAASGHGDDWGINNLSSAADHGRLIIEPTPPIVYQTKDVTVYKENTDGTCSEMLTSGDWQV